MQRISLSKRKEQCHDSRFHRHHLFIWLFVVFSLVILSSLSALADPIPLYTLNLDFELSQYFFEYDGSEKRPRILSVRNGDITLKEGEDYVFIEYSDNTMPGYASVHIRGIGNYTEEAWGNFVIYQKGTWNEKYVFEASQTSSADGVWFNAKLPSDGGLYYYLIMRSKSPNGPFVCYDLINTEGRIYRSSSHPYWYTYGEKGHSLWYIINEDEGYYSFLVETDPYSTWYYQVYVIDGNDHGRCLETNVVAAAMKIDTPVFLKMYSTVNKKAVKLSWTKVARADGYELYRKNGGKWVKLKTTSKLKYTDKKVKPGKKYQYRLRAFLKKNGKKFYSDYSNTIKVKVKAAKVKGTYKSGAEYGTSLTKSKLKELRQVVEGFKTNYIRSSMKDWQKVYVAFSYLREICRYGSKKYYNTAWGALVNGNATCVGYARGMKALCDAIGIPCRFVRAAKKSVNPNHAWNLVKVDGAWYIVDAQGGLFLFSSKDYGQLTGEWYSTKQYPKSSATSHRYAMMMASEM